MIVTLGDAIIFVVFLAVVIGISLYASRGEKAGGEAYFLAGRRLVWPLIGFSLIASNISTEHFVGMAGDGFGERGLAVASFEWIAAVALVVMAWWLLPKFLQAGIYTMPQYLEYRYDSLTRTLMAVVLTLLTIFALLVTVLYSGSRGLDGVFGFSDMAVEHFGLSRDAAVFWTTWAGAWFIGICAAAYTVYGGLRAVVWSDLLQGGALLLGGAVVLYLGLKIVGGGEVTEFGVEGGSVMEGWRTFTAENEDRLSVGLPADDPVLPWTALFTGMLIPNIFYWGMNQFIVQRTLGAKSLAEGQKGIFLACAFKLIMPFIIIVPGIIAFQLYGDTILERAGGDMGRAGELAYPHLIAQIMPPLLRGVMLAALGGAVMSTFNSGINSAATMYTVDIHNTFVNKNTTGRQEVFIGRTATALIALVACIMAPLPGLFEGVFHYIQEIWGFISPAVVTAFIVGLVVPRAPALAGRVALILGPLLYALFRVPGWVMDGLGYGMEDGAVVRDTEAVSGAAETLFRFFTLPYLHHMFITFLVLAAIMGVITWRNPLSEPRTMPVSNIDVHPHPLRYVYGGLILAAVLALYIIFW
ncbi:MAG: solute:sodium symporter family transporter [Candidatus Hydrogenedentota bacterium]